MGIVHILPATEINSFRVVLNAAGGASSMPGSMSEQDAVQLTKSIFTTVLRTYNKKT